MQTKRSFRFLDECLNRQLIAAFGKSEIKHAVAKDGTIRYSPADEHAGEDLICSVRAGVFPSWQILTCPPDWIAVYREYMNDHAIRFHEEIDDGTLWFLLSRRLRPHMWKLDCPMQAERIAT